MTDTAAIAGVAHVIQLAVAPVFLLTGVGAILGVLVNRLARVVDRFRHLDGYPAQSDQALVSIRSEMGDLSRRAKLIHWAIGLCTSSALLVCVVIVVLFVGSLMRSDLSTPISVLFILAMLALVTGLLCFLREIAVARTSIHVVPH